MGVFNGEIDRYCLLHSGLPKQTGRWKRGNNRTKKISEGPVSSSHSDDVEAGQLQTHR